MKKILSVFCVFAIMTMSFMACGNKEEALDGPVHIGSLKGPTSMGLLYFMEEAKQGKLKEEYDFTMVTAADELLAMVVQGEIDIALVPANMASLIYLKTNAEVSVIDINTLGVLYMVSSDEGIQSFSDLRGREIYVTGKGTTPDLVLQYLLSANQIGVNEVTIEYKSEAAEVLAVLSQKESAVGVLPQPFATVATVQNENMKVVLDLNKEWESLQGEEGSKLVTGVTIVRNEFLKEHEGLVKDFLKQHKESAAYANSNVEEVAELVEAAGIVPKAAIAKMAIPRCNITYIDGKEMQAALEGYLEILIELNPEFVGGALPASDFYFID